ncbi:glycosyltransferase [uncultured Muribaculum sp.]|nr:glycosyltransferase [uncultured Muribaculum sp.]TGY02982.1 glycosyltransferase [Muribaculum sp. NM65_B17]THG41328.1 glycosyltransferase [Muribaculaceae bacterium]
MMGLPMVSVIVLAYNQEQTISRTIDSILNQDCDFPIEIIIGEDASSDKTREICSSYAGIHDNIILLEKAPNKGILINYNDCLKACRGKYISECAGDDWWHNRDKLRLQVSYMDMNPKCILCYTDYNQFLVYKNKINGSILGNCKINNKEILNKILEGFFIPTLTIMYRRDAIDYFNMIDFNNQGYLAEDLPMYLELCKYGTLDYIPVSTSTYTLRKGSVSQFATSDKMVIFMENMRKIKLDFIQKNQTITQVDKNEINNIYDKLIFNTAFSMCDYNIANEYYSKIIGNKNMSIKIKNIICHNLFLFKIYTLLRRII